MLRQLRVVGGWGIRVRLRRRLQRFLRESRAGIELQRKTLARILALNAESDFSRERGLSPGLSIREFRHRLAISDFETFRPYVERMKQGETSALLGRDNKLLMFTLSSGTTAESKYIPITRPFLTDYRRGWSLWGIRAFDAHPAMHQRDIIQLSSDYDQFRTPAGTPCGNISGLVGAMQSPLVRLMYTVPLAVGRIGDPEAKLYTSLRLSVANAHVGLVMTANPSTLVQWGRRADEWKWQLIRDVATGGLSSDFSVPGNVRDQLNRRIRKPDLARARQLERLVETHGRLAPVDIWPRLAFVGVWTGGSAGAYLPAMRQYFGNVPVRDHGLSASEGRMTVPLEDETSAGLLDVESHFFEFIPESEQDSPDPTVLLAHELKEGEQYLILLTTASGLYRYNIRDVVRCRGFHGQTPILEFLHKGAHMSNLTGEKLSESHVVAAVAEARRNIEIDHGDFTISPIWGDPPRYRIHLEPGPLATSQFAAVVDHELQRQNVEYRDKRRSARLDPLELCVLPQGSWKRFARARQSRLGGSLEQYKHPCLSPDLEFSNRLLREHTGHSEFQQPHFLTQPAAQRSDTSSNIAGSGL